MEIIAMRAVAMEAVGTTDRGDRRGAIDAKRVAALPTHRAESPGSRPVKSPRVE